MLVDVNIRRFILILPISNTDTNSHMLQKTCFRRVKRCKINWTIICIDYVSLLVLDQGSGTHYNDVIMSTMSSQITSLTIVYSTVYSGVYQRRHQSSASLAFVWGIHRWPVNSPHKCSVTRIMFPLDNVIMWCPTLPIHMNFTGGRSSG